VLWIQCLILSCQLVFYNNSLSCHEWWVSQKSICWVSLSWVSLGWVLRRHKSLKIKRSFSLERMDERNQNKSKKLFSFSSTTFDRKPFGQQTFDLQNNNQQAIDYWSIGWNTIQRPNVLFVDESLFMTYLCWQKCLWANCFLTKRCETFHTNKYNCNDTQPNNIQHDDTQHNDIKQNYNQHNNDNLAEILFTIPMFGLSMSLSLWLICVDKNAFWQIVFQPKDMKPFIWSSITAKMLNLTTFSIMTLSIMTLSIMTYSEIKLGIITYSWILISKIINTQHTDTQ
jgi:hypothetical protein